jgi:hypothetical protein
MCIRMRKPFIFAVFDPSAHESARSVGHGKAAVVAGGAWPAASTGAGKRSAALVHERALIVR